MTALTEQLDPFAFLVVLAGAMALLSFIAGYLPLRREWSPATLKLFVAFGGGALIGAAFLLIGPEALELMEAGDVGEGLPLDLELGMLFGFSVLTGFMFMLLVENFGVVHDLHEEEDCQVHAFGWVAFVGLTLHTFIDGVALGAAASTDEFATLGLVVFIAIAAHKAPASFTLGSLLLHAGYQRRRVARYVGVFSVMVLIGAVVSFWALSSLGEALIGATLAFSAGTFIYVAAVDVLPEMHHEATGRHRSVGSLMVGTLVVLGFTLLM